MSSTPGPIFIIGSGRAGTTLLRFMLCAHPRIYVTHEASFYVWEAMFPKGRPARDYAEYYLHTPSFRWLRADPKPILAALPDPLRRESMGEFYAAVMREKAATYGRPRFGDKTPSHSAYLHRIFADFPDAKVVHIVRDPRGTVTSLSRMPWASASLFANALFCDVVRKQTSKYGDRMLTIRLEDLLAEPRATMVRVLEYVGEPWDDAVLDHAKHIPAKDDMPPLPWLESARQDRGAPQAQWTSLTSVQVRMIERITRKTMRECSYEPARFDREPSRLAVWVAGLREVPEMLRCLYVYLRLSRLMRDWHNFDSDEVRAVFRRVNPSSWARYPGFDLPLPPPLGSGRGDETAGLGEGSAACAP